ncbi:hypothetical protein Tco_0901616 [Tanacetum coccineum]
MTNSEMKFDEVVTPVNKEKDASYRELTEINTRVQDEGQTGLKPGKQDEGYAGSNPSNAAEFQPQPNEEFTTTAYPSVQENLKLPTRDQVILEEPTNSTGTLSSLQNLDKELSFTNQFFVKKPHELEQHMANLIQDNSALEERLNKHGPRLYNLENLNIPQKVNKALDEIVTDAVDWALQAPLRAHFRDLPEADMKEILLQ